MCATYKNQDIFQFIRKTGYEIEEDMLQNINLHYQRSFDFSPEFTMFFASYTVKSSFTHLTKAPIAIKDCICFFFRNIFDEESTNAYRNSKTTIKKPAVHIFPSTHSYISHFKKHSYKKMMVIFMSADYLKSFLKEDVEQFQFLFNTDNTFLIEEIMTDNILRTVNAIVKKEKSNALESYYYKLKATELLYNLFRSLNQRKKTDHQILRAQDIKSIYSMRDKLVSSLNQPTPIAELKKISGMNTLKMRKIFTQIFGMGIYDYFQHFRMKEAARLIREEKRSVSEAGYRMGFENLSHFSRVFKKHIGKLPKQYSMEFA